MKLMTLGIVAMTGLALSACNSLSGLSDRGLSPCPDKPNCVSSHSSDDAHAIASLAYTGSREAALKRLKTLVTGLPRTKVITETENYLHVECRSKWFRFVDDVEFWLPESQPGVIHLRSAARLGYSDLGVNRKRVENIRSQFDPDGK